jgi:hypothetical protein
MKEGRRELVGVSDGLEMKTKEEKRTKKKGGGG